MTREVAHQKSFEKALYSIQGNFPPGKLPGIPEYSNKYYDMSQGEGNLRGPWNEGDQWEYMPSPDKTGPVDGGDGSATVYLNAEQKECLEQSAMRTASAMKGNPLTGADLGAKRDGSGGKTTPAH